MFVDVWWQGAWQVSDPGWVPGARWCQGSSGCFWWSVGDGCGASLTSHVLSQHFDLSRPPLAPGPGQAAAGSSLEQLSSWEQLVTRPLLPVPVQLPPPATTTTVSCLGKCKVQQNSSLPHHSLQLMAHKVKCFNGNCSSFISRNSRFHFLVLK